MVQKSPTPSHSHLLSHRRLPCYLLHILLHAEEEPTSLMLKRSLLLLLPDSLTLKIHQRRTAGGVCIPLLSTPWSHGRCCTLPPSCSSCSASLLPHAEEEASSAGGSQRRQQRRSSMAHHGHICTQLSKDGGNGVH